MKSGHPAMNNFASTIKSVISISIGGFLIVSVFSLVCSQSAAIASVSQQSYSWIGETGNWDVPANWNPVGVPGPNDMVTITNGEVSIGGNRSVGQLTVGTSGRLTGTGNLNISGTLTMNNANAVLDIDGSIETGDLFTWSGGLLGGDGVLYALGGVNITGVVGSGKILDGREIDVAGGTAMTITGVQFNGRNGARFRIRENAVLDIALNNNFSIFTVSEGGAEIVNEGTILKSTGTTGLIPIDWAIVNSGVILIEQPDAHLRLTGPLIDQGGTYRVDHGTLTFDSRGRIEPFVFTSASSIISSPGTLIRFSSFPNSTENSIYEVSGLIDIQGDLAVNKFALFGSNNSVVRILSDANLVNLAAETLTVGTGGELISELEDEVMLNHVGINTNGYLEFSGNVIIDSTFSLSINGAVFHSDHTTTVNGEMEWRGGRISGSGTTITGGGLLITGTSISASWTKRLAGHRLLIPEGQTAVYTGYLLTGSDGGMLEVAEGASLELVNNLTSNFFNVAEGGARLINRGTITKTEGTTSRYDIHWDFENHGLLLLDQEDAHLQFTGHQFDDGGEYRVIRGRLTFNARTNPDLNIFAAGSLIYGGPESTIEFAARANLTDLQQLNTYYEIHGDLQIYGHLVIRRIQGDRFSNLTIREHSGEIDLASATIQVGEPNGRLLSERTDSLTFGSLYIGYAGSVTLESPLTILETFRMESGRTSVEVSLFDSNYPVYVLGKTTWTGGTMRGASRTYMTGGLEISGNANSVLLIKRLEERGLILPAGPLHTHNGGLLTGAEGGYIQVETGAEFRILATSDNSQFVHSTGGATIYNYGLIRRSDGNTSRMNIDWHLENHGRVEIDQEGGHFRFSRTIDDRGGEYHAENGRLNIALAASPNPYLIGMASRFTAASSGWINFGGQNGDGQTTSYELSGTFDIEGILSVRNLSGTNLNLVRPEVTMQSEASIVNLAGNSLQMGGRFGKLTIAEGNPVTCGNLMLYQNGSLIIDRPLMVEGSLLMDQNSILSTDHQIDVQELMTWNGGSLEGPGTTRLFGGVDVFGTVSSFGSSRNLREHHLDLHSGNAIISGSWITGRDGARITIGEAVSLEFRFIQNQMNIQTGSTEVPVLVNRGSIITDEDQSLVIISWQIINEGTLDFGQNGMSLQNSREVLNRGVIRGSGTLTGDLLNETGTIAPGYDSDLTGQLTISGTLTQQEDAAIQIRIGGPVPGTDHDQVQTGSAILSGTLSLTLADGFTPPLGQFYRVFTFNEDAITGQFDTIESPDLDELVLTSRYISDAIEVFAVDGVIMEPPPSLTARLNSPPFQRLGRDVPISLEIKGAETAVIFRVRGRNTEPPETLLLTPECPTDDGYENLKCRLAPFGVVPPEPEDGVTYPILATNPFPNRLPLSDGPSDREWERTAVLPSDSDLTHDDKERCEANLVEAEIETGLPVSEVNMAACAFAIARVLLDFTPLPGKSCIQLALGIGEYVVKGTYDEQFDLAAYMVANIIGATACASNFIPPTKVLTIILEINSLINTFGRIENAFLECSGIDTPEMILSADRTQTACIASFDPNDKLGPEGVLADRYIASGDSMGYVVFFENLESATAAAQVVIITDTLDVAVVDLDTFSFGMVAWSDTSAILTPDSLNAFRASANVDLRPAIDLVVNIEADLDTDTGVITWVFDSLDPLTLEPTPDPLAGFLPPNNETFDGEGLVSYFVSLREDVPSATRFGSAARIIFDDNEPIDTPVWSNILDTEAPVSAVSPLDSVQTSAEFTVSWSGQDDASGIRNYTIYVSENSGEPEIWLTDTEATSMVYPGSDGSTYAFWSSAADQVGNRSERGTGPEAVTTVQVPTSIERPDLPAEFNLSQNYPNPFNPSTVIRFGLPEAADIRLEVFDLAGRRVAVLAVGSRAAGWHTISFDGSALSSGVYVYRLQAGDFVQSRKLVLVK